MMKNQEVKKSMETKENESGRSMVETLGVLAVMGVLSIGGVAGYRWAMGKYNTDTDPGLVTETLISCEDECRIKTEECEGDNPTGFKLNNGTCIRCSCSCRTDDNTNQGNCSVCDGQNGRDKRYYMNGACYKTCPTGSTANEATQTCVPESGYLCDVAGPCYSCSDSGKVEVGTTDEGKAMCLSCDGTNGTTKRYYLSGYCYQTCPTGSTANEATQECVPESGYLCSQYGSCYSCSDSGKVEVGTTDEGKAACLSCNTGSDKRLYGDGNCYSCSYSWAVEVGTTDEGKAACLSCDGTNGTTKRFYSRGNCYSCSDSWNVEVGTTDEGKAACLSCNTGSDKRFYGDGYCYSCSDSSSRYVGESDEGKAMCLSCNTGTDKRYYMNGYCYKTCPSASTANGQECVPENGYFCYGSCLSCSYSDSVWIGTSDAAKEACHSCNTGANKRYYSYGDCYPCPTSLSGLNTQEKCTQCGGTWNDSVCS